MTGRRWRDLGEWLRQQQRPVRRADLESRWTQWSVREAIAHGVAVRMLPGIVAAAECARDARVRGLALNLWHPDLLVTGRLALHLFRPTLEVPGTALAVVPSGIRLAASDWVTVLQRGPVMERRRANGVWCVSPARALIDAWHGAPRSDAEESVYQALWVGVCTAPEALRELEAMPRVGRRRQLTNLLLKFTQGATSPLEVYAREKVFVGAEWTELEWQATLETEGSRRRPDALHRKARVVIEFDGVRWHGSPESRERDRLRDVELSALGYMTLRFTFADLRNRPDWCRQMVRAAIRHRASKL